MPERWLPMSEFDPSKPALVHDKLNDQVIDWEPERHGKDYKAGHRDFGDGVVEWDGLLLDRWREKRDAPPVRTTPNETLALHLMHRLYEATEGRPNRWRMLAGMQLTQATLELAVERGWLIVDKVEHSVALTEAGRERVRRWRDE